MGFWGSGLYANDTTSDVRDSYMECLMDQMSDQDAYDKIMEKFSEYFDDEDEGPLVWYALADTQWKVGRLLPEVKEKALYWIENNGGLDPWQDTPCKGKGWLKTLDKLREKLNSPMPKRKNVRRPDTSYANPWNLYDVYAYQFHGKESEERGVAGKYMVLQKIGEGIPFTNLKTVVMRLQVFDRIFDELPSLDDLNNVRLLPLDFPTRVDFKRNPIWMSGLFDIGKKALYQSEYLIYLGNFVGPSNNMMNKHVLLWENNDENLYHFHSLWKNISYETVGDGIFHYLPKDTDEKS